MEIYPSEQQYLSKFPKSKELYEKAGNVFSRGVTHDSWFLRPFPIFMKEGKDSHVWDVDGFEYIDYFGGHGTLLLGHAHPSLVEAVQEQILKGTHLGASDRAGVPRRSSRQPCAIPRARSKGACHGDSIRPHLCLDCITNPSVNF